MNKKTERITFRTTEECNEHLKDINERYDLPIGDIVHRMVNYFIKSAGKTGTPTDWAEKTFKELTK